MFYPAKSLYIRNTNEKIASKQAEIAMLREKRIEKTAQLLLDPHNSFQDIEDNRAIVLVEYDLRVATWELEELLDHRRVKEIEVTECDLRWRAAAAVMAFVATVAALCVAIVQVVQAFYEWKTYS
jgi:hypothetical protein